MEVWKKTCIPWIIAVSIYYLLNSVVNHESLSLLAYIKEFIVPYYHLWYVCGYMFCIILSILIFKLTNNINYGVLLLLIIGVFMAMGFIVQDAIGIDNIISKFINLTVRPQNLLFFSIGTFGRNIVYLSKFNREGGIQSCLIYLKWVLIPVFILLSPLGFVLQNYWYETAVQFFLLALIFCGIDFTKYENKRACKILCSLGENTFPIYLWHVIGKIIGLSISNGIYNTVYYIICIIWIVLLLCLLSKSQKYSLLRSIIGR